MRFTALRTQSWVTDDHLVVTGPQQLGTWIIGQKKGWSLY